MSEDQGSLPPFALPETLAQKFHETYERLAPRFGYVTRPATRAFNPDTPNGQLMIAVMREAFAPTSQQASKSGSELKSDILKGAEG